MQQAFWTPRNFLEDELSLVRVFQEWHPQTFYWCYVINRQSLALKHMVHTSLTSLTSRTYKPYHLGIQTSFNSQLGKLRQHMLQEVKSELTQGHAVSIILKENVHPEFHRTALWWKQPRLEIFLSFFFFFFLCRLCNAWLL